jgi:putative PEP-CTERM system TPR-repeat lipoprotein
MKHHKKLIKKTLILISIIELILANNTYSANLLNQSNNIFENQLDNSLELGNKDPITSNSGALELLEKNNQDTKIIEIIKNIEKRNFLDAHQAISSLLESEPNNPNVYILEALTYKLEKRQDLAKEQLQKALALDSKNVIALNGLATILIFENQLQEAKSFLAKILEIEKNNINALIALADIANKQNDPGKAEDLLKLAFEETKTEASPSNYIAKLLLKVYFSKNRNHEINQLADNLVKRFPNNSESLTFKVNALLLNKKEEQAEEYLKEIIVQKPSEMIHRIALASIISKQQGRDNEVIEILDQIISMNPKKLQAYTLKVDYLIDQNRYPEALELSEHIKNKFPKLSIGDQLKGLIYSKNNEISKAIDAYKSGILVQNNPELYLKITELLEIEGKSEDAIKFLDESLKKISDNSALRIKLAILSEKKGDIPNAKDNYKLVLKNDPENITALNNLANIYIHEKNPESIKFAKAAYTLKPELISTIDTYGYSLIKNGKLEEGIALLKNAEAYDPNALFVKIHLAEGLILNNQKIEAIKILEPILKDNTDFAERSEAQKLFNNLQKNNAQ